MAQPLWLFGTRLTILADHTTTEVLRDGVLAHLTMTEGLNLLFSKL